MIRKLIKSYKSLSENDSIVFRNTVGSFVVKGFSLVISLFTMPAYLKFFNNEMVLGIWFTVLSVLSWILNFDLGIGNGLRNCLAASLATKEIDKAKKYISSAYISTASLVAIASVAFWILFDFVNWNTVLNIETTIISQSALTTTVKIVFMGIMIQFLFKLISSILYAMQRSSLNSMMSLITSLITIIAVSVIPSKSNDTNIIVMAVVHALAVLLPLLVTTICIFTRKKFSALIPSFKYFRFAYAKEILSLGGLFLLVQVFYMLIMSTNDYLITLLYSAGAVVEYQIYNKIFSLGSTIFALALTPIWSAVTKALAEKDQAWVSSLFSKLCRLAVIASICEFLIIPFLQLGVNIWLKDDAIRTSIPYAIVFATMGSLLIWNSVLSSIANGLGKLRIQLICFAIGAAAKVFLSWFFVASLDSWIGVPIANVICMAIYCIVEPLFIKKKIKSING